MKRRKNNRILKDPYPKWNFRYAESLESKRPGSNRKCEYNQLTGERRYVGPSDEYDCDGHAIQYKKMNTVCFDCEFTAKLPYTVPYEFRNHYNETRHCPHCGKELVSIGFRLRVPKKGKWMKDKRLMAIRSRIERRKMEHDNYMKSLKEKYEIQN